MQQIKMTAAMPQQYWKKKQGKNGKKPAKVVKERIKRSGEKKNHGKMFNKRNMKCLSIDLQKATTIKKLQEKICFFHRALNA